MQMKKSHLARRRFVRRLGHPGPTLQIPLAWTGCACLFPCTSGGGPGGERGQIFHLSGGAPQGPNVNTCGVAASSDPVTHFGCGQLPPLQISGSTGLRNGWSDPVSQKRKLRPRVVPGHMRTGTQGAALGAAHLESPPFPHRLPRPRGAAGNPSGRREAAASWLCAPWPEQAAGHQAGWHGEMDDTHCQWAQPKEISHPGARPPSLRVGIVPPQPAHSC